jgi:hypothetical protein
MTDHERFDSAVREVSVVQKCREDTPTERRVLTRNTSCWRVFPYSWGFSEHPLDRLTASSFALGLTPFAVGEPQVYPTVAGAGDFLISLKISDLWWVSSPFLW